MAKIGGAGPHGIALLDKPAGVTSTAVVGRVRWALGTKKVGHAGTLDPMATGLLVFGVGRGTKLLQYLLGSDKRYTATIRLGFATSTDDAMGERLHSVGCLCDHCDDTAARSPAALPSAEAIRAAISDFRGVIAQRPSSVSAIKVAGERAYNIARSGRDVQLAERPVTIHEYSVLSITPTTSDAGERVVDVDVDVTCSSGTYIRALARDLGERFAVGGHLTVLRRHTIGPFSLDEAAPIDNPTEGCVPLLPLGEAASRLMEHETFDDSWVDDLVNGRLIERAGEPREPLAILDHSGALVALAKQTRGHVRPISVFRSVND